MCIGNRERIPNHFPHARFRELHPGIGGRAVRMGDTNRCPPHRRSAEARRVIRRDRFETLDIVASNNIGRFSQAPTGCGWGRPGIMLAGVAAQWVGAELRRH